MLFTAFRSKKRKPSHRYCKAVRMALPLASMAGACSRQAPVRQWRKKPGSVGGSPCRFSGPGSRPPKALAAATRRSCLLPSCFKLSLLLSHTVSGCTEGLCTLICQLAVPLSTGSESISLFWLHTNFLEPVSTWRSLRISSPGRLSIIWVANGAFT